MSARSARQSAAVMFTDVSAEELVRATEIGRRPTVAEIVELARVEARMPV